MNLYATEEMGKGESYVAPDPHFISTISLLASSLPWEKFEKFFETKKMVKLKASEHLILLRLVALQELLCLNDDELLKWAKHQLYLLSFMQVDFQPRIPTKELLKEFRTNFEKVGLLKPFRRQCLRLINEHEQRFPPLDSEVSSLIGLEPDNMQQNSQAKYRLVSDTKVDLPNIHNTSDCSCPNCGSKNVLKLNPSQEASTLPNISFSRCRFCGNTFRD